VLRFYLSCGIALAVAMFGTTGSLTAPISHGRTVAANGARRPAALEVMPAANARSQSERRTGSRLTRGLRQATP